ncbi:MAG: hypothetical protein IKY74_03020 [Alistipes sp.]|nr:hypothetical protein [Alistipes sp.]
MDYIVAHWQDVAVVIIAIIVGIVIIHKLWHFFHCGPQCDCSGCTKECNHRKRE